MTNPAPEQSVTISEQAAYERGKQDAVKQLTTPTMSGWRVACGLVWAFWTLIFTIGIFVNGTVGGTLLCIVLAGLSGWYDYRIWALKARRLTLFLIF